MTEPFKNKYKCYAIAYTDYLSKKADKHKQKIHKILEPYVYEKGVCKMITDYLPYKRNNKEYNFGKIRTWVKDTTFAYNMLSEIPDIINILMFYLKKEKYMNKIRLHDFISGLDFLFSNVYMDEPGIHIFYTLLLELQKHSSFKIPTNCETIQDFQVFLKFSDTYGYELFERISYFIDKRIFENYKIGYNQLEQVVFTHNIHEIPQEYECYNECGCLESCNCDCTKMSCKCRCEWCIYTSDFI